MELEIGIEDLLNKRKIESDRIEFKAGWNPDDIYRTICAFANDFNNDGGGYIVVGVEEENGVAVRPVKGLPEYMLDDIEKEMVGYNNVMSPPYFPKAVPTEVDGKWILVIVARAGQQRPYKAPEHVTDKKLKKYNYYIRYLTSSVRANVRSRGVEKILEDMQLLVGPPELRYIRGQAFCFQILPQSKAGGVFEGAGSVRGAFLRRADDSGGIDEEWLSTGGVFHGRGQARHEGEDSNSYGVLGG